MVVASGEFDFVGESVEGDDGDFFVVVARGSDEAFASPGSQDGFPSDFVEGCLRALGG
jgi:hypothetical protein